MADANAAQANAQDGNQPQAGNGAPAAQQQQPAQQQQQQVQFAQQQQQQPDQQGGGNVIQLPIIISPWKGSSNRCGQERNTTIGIF